MRIVLYACTNLGYDQVFPPVQATPGVEHVFFLDPPRPVRGWEVRALPAGTAGLSDAMTNRYVKFFPHRLFPDADISVYVDANTLLLRDLSPLIEEFRASEAAIGLFPHKQRFSIEEEIAFSAGVGKLSGAEVEKARAQLAAYQAEGLGENYVFTENAILFRDHRHPGLAGAMDLWWAEMARFTRRDQLSLPYVLHKTGLEAHIWDWNYKFDNPYFYRYAHRESRVQDINVYLKNRMYYSSLERAAYGALLGLYHALRGTERTVWGPQPETPSPARSLPSARKED